MRKMSLIPYAGKVGLRPNRDKVTVISLQSRNKQLTDEIYKLRAEKLCVERELRICRAEKEGLEASIARVHSIVAAHVEQAVPVGRFTIEEILVATCAHFGVSPEAIRGFSRQRDIMLARHIAMYLSATVVGSTLLGVARELGNRDHTTVSNAIKRIRRIMPSVAHDIALIKARLQNTSTEVSPRGEGARASHDQNNLVPPEKDGAGPPNSVVGNDGSAEIW